MKQPFKDAAIELLKIQCNIVEMKQKVFIIFERRDAAGKEGSIQ